MIRDCNHLWDSDPRDDLRGRAESDRWEPRTKWEERWRWAMGAFRRDRRTDGRAMAMNGMGDGDGEGGISTGKGRKSGWNLLGFARLGEKREEGLRRLEEELARTTYLVRVRVRVRVVVRVVVRVRVRVRVRISPLAPLGVVPPHLIRPSQDPSCVFCHHGRAKRVRRSRPGVPALSRVCSFTSSV